MRSCIVAKAVVIGGVAVAAVRRLSRRSGVTDVEYSAQLPGDDVIADAMVEWTRATTVQAPPEQVWPWLVQMGYGRGGWYTNERFDRLVWRLRNPSSNHIMPEWQHLAAGDIVPDGPDYAAYFRVVEIRDNETIVYRSIRHPYRGRPLDPADDLQLRQRESELVAGGFYFDFSWVFALRPGPGDTTRLVVRTRATVSPAWLRFTEPALGLVDLFHVSTMFRGIKRRVSVPAPPDQVTSDSTTSR